MLPHDPDAPIEVVCAATYYADLIPAYAFVFRVQTTKTRFTVYASTRDAYTINATYRLRICDPAEVLLCLPTDQAAFLRHCLTLIEDRWQEAIAEADAGAARAESDRTAGPGRVNAEPTPAGYRTIADRFRAELDRATRLHAGIDEITANPRHDRGDVEEPS